MADGIQVREGGIEQWAGEPDSFDAVTMSHVIEHVHDPLADLADAFRLLRPGGLLFIDTPNIDALGHQIYGPHWRGLEPPRHLVIFNVKALQGALAKTGFEDICWVPRPQPFMLLSVVSACSEQGRRYTDDVDTSGLRLPTRAQRLRARLTRYRQEFLTVTCLKPAEAAL
jgi:SAM-dependent methyltransferase